MADPEDTDQTIEIASDAKAEGVVQLPDGGFAISGTFSHRVVFGTGDEAITLGSGETPSTRGFLARFDHNGDVVLAEQAREDLSGSASSVTSRTACPDGSTVIGGVFEGAISFAEDDSIVIQSHGYPNSSRRSMFVATYDNNNQLSWVKPLLSKTDNWMMALSVSEACDVVFTGSVGKGSNFGTGANPVEVTIQEGLITDTFVARYDAEGTLAWVSETY
jgi:hypothetical protein